jgi:TatD DNase family protein
MKAHKAEELGGIIHCFSYGVEMAREYLDMGFSIGVGGVVTFKNGKKLKEVVEYTPLDRIVLETDAPYLAPHPLRGTLNHSGNLEYTNRTLAAIFGMDEAECAALTTENAKRIFRL